MPIVYLDSNIYRQLGLKFKENIDFKNLSNLLETSGNEFGLLEVVLEELMDYYKNDIFGAIFIDHERLYKRYQANPYLDDITIPETTISFNKAIESVKNDLKTNKFFSLLPEVQPKFILDFLLQNKRLGKKDNTRDFLIFYTLVTLCKKHNEDHLVLISQDEIFTANDFFKKTLISESVKNLKVYPSITDFIKDFGPKIDFITTEILLGTIEKNAIEQELLKDIKCFPSYISQYYNKKKEKDVPEIESLVLGELNIDDFYVVKDYKTNQLKVNVTVEVPIKATFHPENKKEELNEYLSSIEKRQYSRHKNNFDKDGRPIFDNSVLFIFEGEVNEAKNSIDKLVFIDFIPDYFIIEDLKQQINLQPIIITENAICQHEFDTENGYWRNSRYGGGLSWHYHCKKCGAEFDTGDFYN
jgi:hypothetical protein